MNKYNENGNKITKPATKTTTKTTTTTKQQQQL